MLRSQFRLSRHVVNEIRRGVRTRPAKPLPPSPARANAPAIKHATESQEQGRKTNPGIDLKKMPRAQLWGLWASLALALGLGVYGSQLVIAARSIFTQEDVQALSIAEQKDVAQRYDEIADSFDNDVNFSEYVMGILNIRKSLAAACVGNVLEVSCGTGRNLGYFDLDLKNTRVKSLTFIDLSPQMVDVCKRKWAALYSSRSLQTGYYAKRSIRFLTGSALDLMPLAPDGEKYDTIIQTMGLCSTAEPVELLTNIARHLNSDNDKARIYLLEHGRAEETWSSRWLNKVLDTTAEKHAELYGCWYNRDIDEIVDEAAKATGLMILRKKRRHLGTTFVYELKVDPKQIEKFKKI